MISEIAVRKNMRSSMADKPKDTIPHEEKRIQELNLFDPRTNIHGNVQESAYQNSFILCHYQPLLPSYLNLLRICRLQPP